MINSGFLPLLAATALWELFPSPSSHSNSWQLSGHDLWCLACCSIPSLPALSISLYWKPYWATWSCKGLGGPPAASPPFLPFLFSLFLSLFLPGLSFHFCVDSCRSGLVQAIMTSTTDWLEWSLISVPKPWFTLLHLWYLEVFHFQKKFYSH